MNRQNKTIFLSKIPIAIAFFLICEINSTNAQNVGIGIKAGFNKSMQLNNFKFSSSELTLDLDPAFTTGFNLGLIYRNRIARNFRIQAEPTFLRIGARYKESFTFRGFEFQTDSETKLSYIQLPLVLNLTTTPPDLAEFPRPWEETTYHLSTGFYGSYLLDAIFSGINSGTPLGVDFEQEFSNDVTSQFNEYDAGLILGGGLEHGLHNKIGVETVLMVGLLNSKNETATEIKPNNLSISFSVYYIF